MSRMATSTWMATSSRVVESEGDNDEKIAEIPDENIQSIGDLEMVDSSFVVESEGDNDEKIAEIPYENIQSIGDLEMADSSFGERDDCVQYMHLYRAVDEGNLQKTKSFLDTHTHDFLTASLTRYSDQALHIAALAGHLSVVKELVNRIPEEGLKSQNAIGATCLHYAAATGIKTMAECMVEKNRGLLSIPCKDGLLPVVYASLGGYKDMARYLYDETPKPELCPEKGRSGATLLTSSIFSDDYGICVQSTDGCRKFQGDIERPEEGQSGRENMIIQLFNRLQGLFWNLIIVVPGIKHIYDTKLKHFQARKVLDRILDLLSDKDYSELVELAGAELAIFDAVKHGIVEFVAEIIKFYPSLIWSTDQNGLDIFLSAVLHRQEKIFSLLYGLGALKTRIVSRRDRYDNNILHLAGMLAPAHRRDQVPGAALQFQRELLWRNEVEAIYPPVDREETNFEGKTPRELFVENHVGLIRAGETWMKNTATSAGAVATLIATVMFAAAFTIPGGISQDTGIPLRLHLTSVQVFIISDALSLYSSCISVLMFLALYTSRYAEEDFLKSLPQKLMIGLFTLFFSMATMMIAYGAAVANLVSEGLPWATIPIYLLACIPVSLFALLQFRLLVEIFLSTYGAGIFNKQTRRWGY